MSKYVWKACHKGHNRFMKNTRVELATFTQCIDHILATKSSRYPTAKLSLPYPTPRASRQICGLQWDRDSDSLPVFDGLCQSLSSERKGRQLYWVYNAWSSRPMITPCMSHIQNSHGILSRFPLKGGGRGGRYFSFKVVLSLGLSTHWKAWQLQPAESRSGPRCVLGF